MCVCVSAWREKERERERERERDSEALDRAPSIIMSNYYIKVSLV